MNEDNYKLLCLLDKFNNPLAKFLVCISATTLIAIATARNAINIKNCKFFGAATLSKLHSAIKVCITCAKANQNRSSGATIVKILNLDSDNILSLSLVCCHFHKFTFIYGLGKFCLSLGKFSRISLLPGFPSKVEPV